MSPRSPIKPVARGALILSLLPASVEWLRLKLSERGVALTARTVQRDLVSMEQIGIVERDAPYPSLARWRRTR